MMRTMVQLLEPAGFEADSIPASLVDLARSHRHKLDGDLSNSSACTNDRAPKKLSEGAPLVKLAVGFEPSGTEASGSSREPTETVNRKRPLHEYVDAEPAGSLDPKSRQQAHREHSRRYRANVGVKFQELVEVLCAVKADSGGRRNKSRSALLEEASELLRGYRRSISILEAELVVATRQSMLSWIDGTVSDAKDLHDVVVPTVKLLSLLQGWKYAEVWFPTGMGGMNHKLRLEVTHMNTDSAATAAALGGFQKLSHTFAVEAGVGLVGRVFAAERAEVLNSLQNAETLLPGLGKGPIAVRAAMAVPVSVCGRCEAVVTFFDTEERGENAAENPLLVSTFVNFVGLAYGAKMYKPTNSPRDRGADRH